jgi:hypothetical protein
MNVTEEEILNCPDVYYERTYKTIDWSNSRSQGKRSGSTIKGGMSNAPKGVVTYQGISYAKLPDWELHISNLSRLNGSELTRYLKSRDYGFNHRESMCFSLGMKYLERELEKKAQ